MVWFYAFFPPKTFDKNERRLAYSNFLVNDTHIVHRAGTTEGPRQRVHHIPLTRSSLWAQIQTYAHHGLTGTIQAAVSPSKGELQFPLAICRDREGLRFQSTRTALRHDGKMRATWGAQERKEAPESG